jgi:hypothetical protein
LENPQTYLLDRILAKRKYFPCAINGGGFIQYKKSGGVCETFMSNFRRCSLPMSKKKKKKTIRIFAFKNKEFFFKKHLTYYYTHKVPPKKKLIIRFVRASPPMLSIRHLQKYFSHPSLVIYSFATPVIKLKLGQQIANHVDQLL